MGKNISKLDQKKLGTFLLVGIIVIVFIFVFSFNNQKSLTGHAILSMNTIYQPNDFLKGNLSFVLKSGELIPANSLITVNLDDEEYNYTLSDLVSDSIVSGDYYLEGKGLSGNGAGYGLAGESQRSSEVQFTMIITQTNNQNSISSRESVSVSSDNNSFNSPDNSGSNSEASSSSNNNASATNEVLESTNANAEINSNGENNQNVNDQNTPNVNADSNNAEINSNGENNQNVNANVQSDTMTITGNAITENPGKNKEVKGVVSKGSPYTYNLAEGESAEIKNSSQAVSLSVDKGVVTITTAYSESQNGFGQDYLSSNNYLLNIDLSSLNIPAKQGQMVVSVLFDNKEILSVSNEISVESNNEIINNETILINETFNLTLSNFSQNITINATKVNKNLGDYALTNEELFTLKSKTGENSVNLVKSEIVNERLIVKFQIGSYWIENSYNYNGNIDALKDQIELDRAKWVKSLAEKLSQNGETPQAVNVSIPDYNL